MNPELPPQPRPPTRPDRSRMGGRRGRSVVKKDRKSETGSVTSFHEGVELKDWGLDVWQPEEAIDYSVLDEIDLEEQIDNLYDQTKKSIILEYPAADFEPIKKLYDELKNKGINLSDLFYKAMQKYES